MWEPGKSENLASRRLRHPAGQLPNKRRYYLVYYTSTSISLAGLAGRRGRCLSRVCGCGRLRTLHTHVRIDSCCWYILARDWLAQTNLSGAIESFTYIYSIKAKTIFICSSSRLFQPLPWKKKRRSGIPRSSLLHDELCVYVYSYPP